MKSLVLILLTAGLLASCSQQTPQTGNSLISHSFKVWGNCEQCQSTIEKAAKLPGVSSVAWNENSDTLTVKLDSLLTSSDAVLKAVAEAGYDNERYLANEAAYQQLPECCQYERKPVHQH